jgi:hypothetical protein
MDVDYQARGLPTCRAVGDIDDLGMVSGDHEELVVLSLEEKPDEEPKVFK